jgi:hypothetical protein
MLGKNLRFFLDRFSKSFFLQIDFDKRRRIRASLQMFKGQEEEDEEEEQRKLWRDRGCVALCFDRVAQVVRRWPRKAGRTTMETRLLLLLAMEELWGTVWL